MEFTSIVEFPAKVEFAPSIRSGGRRGTADTVILPPGGRAFNPVVISSRISYLPRTQFLLTGEIIITLSFSPPRPTTDHRLRSEVSLASGASEDWGVDADVEEGI